MTQETKLSQRNRATVSVVETFKCSLGRLKSFKMVPFKIKILATVSYSHFTATMAISLAVSTQYTNVTDTQPFHRATARTALCSLVRL